MLNNPDLKTDNAGLKLKSPILVSSSELTSDLSLLEKLSSTNIGGIVTKTFTTPSENRIRVRPYQFPLNGFGKGYRESGCLYSLATPHVEDATHVLKLVSKMAEICRKASLALVVSYFEDPANASLWADQAKAFEAAGADMLELNFSSPSATKVFGRSFEASKHIIRQIKKKISIPIGLKLSPTLEPLEDFIEICDKAGLNFITAHNAPSGIIIDVENEVPFGAPAIGGYVTGRPFLPYSLARIVRIRRTSQIPVIGVGGIYNANDALQYLLCGSNAIGIGSALYFQGTDTLDNIYDEISNWMREKGYGVVDEFRGKVLPIIEDSVSLRSREKYPFTRPPACPYVPVINDTDCSLCGICESSCIYGVFRLDKNASNILIAEDNCWSCGFCVGVCPTKAIELRDRNDRQRVIWKNQGMAQPFVR